MEPLPPPTLHPPTLTVTEDRKKEVPLEAATDEVGGGGARMGGGGVRVRLLGIIRGKIKIVSKYLGRSATTASLR